MVLSKWTRADVDLHIRHDGVKVHSLKNKRWLVFPYELIKNYASWPHKGFLGISARTEYEAKAETRMFVFKDSAKSDAQKAELAISIFIRRRMAAKAKESAYLAALEAGEDPASLPSPPSPTQGDLSSSRAPPPVLARSSSKTFDPDTFRAAFAEMEDDASFSSQIGVDGRKVSDSDPVFASPPTSPPPAAQTFAPLPNPQLRKLANTKRSARSARSATTGDLGPIGKIAPPPAPKASSSRRRASARSLADPKAVFIPPPRPVADNPETTSAFISAFDAPAPTASSTAASTASSTAPGVPISDDDFFAAFAQSRATTTSQAPTPPAATGFGLASPLQPRKTSYEDIDPFATQSSQPSSSQPSSQPQSNPMLLL